MIIPKNDFYSPFICKFKYSSVVTETEFSDYNNYPIKLEYFGGNENEEKSFFQRKNYIGKANYFNLTLTKELNTNNCSNDNCELCDSNNIDNCITCKYTSTIENNLKICKNIIISNSDEFIDKNNSINQNENCN